MSRVKRFFTVAKSVLQLISKLLPLVGDIVECIKVVDTLVDSFIEQREKGDLKGVSFIDYVSGIVDLISKIAPLGYSFVETCELLFEYVKKYSDFLKESKDAPASALGE